MTQLFDLFDADLFAEMRDQRYVRMQEHPTLPLHILNYTELAQYEQKWNDVTLNCRGLIVHCHTAEVIARGFRKFFNWDDSSQPYPPTGPCLRMPKMDGSLGILYWTGEDWAIATRGSFDSDQARHATKRLRQYENKIKFFEPQEGKSYLFEIIFPDNRIVVDYGTDDRLVLLDVLDTGTGVADLGAFDDFLWPDKVEKISMPGFQDTMASDIPDGEEGFVFYWPQKDFRVKMKSADYLELHRMIFNLSARSVWERLGNGESVEDICVKLPDEFHPWVNNIAKDLYVKQADILVETNREYALILNAYSAQCLLDSILNAYSAQCLLEGKFDGIHTKPSRKWFAEHAVKSPLKAYLFMHYDGKPIMDEIWKTLRPAGNIGVKTLSEDVA